jgi:hypothetical protein
VYLVSLCLHIAHLPFDRFELFKALGSAEAFKVVERKVDLVNKQIVDKLETETLFKPALESEDIKKYVKEVITEMKESGRSRNDVK